MAIHIDVLARIREREVDREVERLADKFDQGGLDASNAFAKRFGDNIERSMAAHSASIARAMDKVKASTLEVAAAESNLDWQRKTGDANQYTAAIERLARAHGQHADASRTASKMIRDFELAAKEGASGIQKLGSDVDRLANSLLGIRGPAGLGIAAVGVLGLGLVDVAKFAVTASQSLALLPAVAAAAGAGMGTLALATSGFDQALKDIRDPKKFATDLASLSPAAQQAALSIQNLLPEFDKLKNATQDSFFAGIGEQIHNLADQYMPSVQALTTSIAGTFNTAMKDIGGFMMQPETQMQMQSIFQNIGTAFQNMEPAVRAVAQAFTDITQVGSTFLPGLGTGIANLAQRFADFIRDARDSGKLREFMQNGIDAVKVLGDGLLHLTEIIYKTFGSDGPANIQTFKSNLEGLGILISTMAGDFDPLEERWSAIFQRMGVTVDNTIRRSLNNAINDINRVIRGINDISPFKDIPQIPAVDAQSAANTGQGGGGGGGYFDIGGGGGGGLGGSLGAPGLGAPPKPGTAVNPAPTGTSGWGFPTSGLPSAGLGPYGGPFPVPAPPPKNPDGTPMSKKDQLDAAKAALDPSTYRVDPYAGLPPGMAPPAGMAAGGGGGGGKTYGPLSYGNNGNPYQKPGLMYDVVDQNKIIDAQSTLEDRAHALEDARKERLALEQSNLGNAEEISQAKWKEHEAEKSLQKAQRDLVDAQDGTSKKLSTSTGSIKNSMQDIGVALDPDLGLGKGLAGFADNLVRFIGNMAAAPMMGQLNAISQYSEATTGIKGGYGILGMRGAQNLSQGLSPLLGNPLPYGASPGSTTTPSFGQSAAGAISLPGGGSTYGLPAGTNTGGYGTGTSATFPPWVIALGQQFGVTPSTYPGHQESDRHEPGYAPNPQHLNRGIDWTGTPAAMQAFAQAMAQLPQAEQVIYNGTTPIEAVAGQPRPGYFAGDLAAHGNHVHTRFAQAPTGLDSYGTGTDAASAYGGTYGATSSIGGLPIPLPVTIVGGGTSGAPGGGGVAGGGGAPAPTGGGAPGATGGGGGLNWDALAGAEAGGNWANTSNPKYSGGLQFDSPTWNQFKPPGAPGVAAQATKDQQIAAAQNALRSGRTPQSLWPQNYGLLGARAATDAAGNPLPAGAPHATTGGPTAPGMYTPPGTNPGAPSATVDPSTGLIPDMPFGLPTAQADPTKIGGLAPIAPNPGGQGIGIMPGGTIDAAIQGGLQAAGGAAGMFGGGAGGAAASAAAQTIMKLANRAIQFGGQAAGIGVSGLMETFLPTGGSELANNNWLTRIAGGIAAAAPALPNLAGGALGQAQQKGAVNPITGLPPTMAPGALTPEQVAANNNQHGMSGGAPPGPQTVINYTNQGATEDRAGADIAYHQSQLPPTQPLMGSR